MWDQRRTRYKEARREEKGRGERAARDWSGAARRDFDQPTLGARESKVLFIYFYKAMNSLLIKPETRKKKRERERRKREEGGRRREENKITRSVVTRC